MYGITFRLGDGYPTRTGCRQDADNLTGQGADRNRRVLAGIGEAQRRGITVDHAHGRWLCSCGCSHGCGWLRLCSRAISDGQAIHSFIACLVARFGYWCCLGSRWIPGAGCRLQIVLTLDDRADVDSRCGMPSQGSREERGRRTYGLDWFSGSYFRFDPQVRATWAVGLATADCHGRENPWYSAGLQCCRD